MKLIYWKRDNWKLPMKVPSENCLLCVSKSWGNSRSNKQNKAAPVLKNSELLQKIIHEINNPQFMKIHDFLITTKLTSKIRQVWDDYHVWDKLAYKANILPYTRVRMKVVYYTWYYWWLVRTCTDLICYTPFTWKNFEVGTSSCMEQICLYKTNFMELNKKFRKLCCFGATLNVLKS